MVKDVTYLYFHDSQLQICLNLKKRSSSETKYVIELSKADSNIGLRCVLVLYSLLLVLNSLDFGFENCRTWYIYTSLSDKQVMFTIVLIAFQEAAG